MPRERWYIDDLQITDGVVFDVETREGLYGSPPLEGSNVVVSQRDGEVWVPKRVGAGSFTLRFWMAGDTREAVEDNWHRLLRHAVKRHKLVRFLRYPPHGSPSARECFGEVIGKLEPTPIGQLGVRAALEVSVPAGVWQDTGDTDTGAIDLSPGGVAPVNRLVDLAGFAGASAPLTRLRITITGYAVDLRVTCPETGTWFEHTGPLFAGQVLTVDAGSDIATAPDLNALRYSGPYMAEAIPSLDPAVPPRLRVTATQANTSATIRVVGRRFYQI